MSLFLPFPPPTYDQATESERNRVLSEADAGTFKRGQDMALIRERLILQSADGSYFQVTVTDAGALVAVAVVL